MRIRVALCAVLVAMSLPVRALAAEGILLLADGGKPEWNTLVAQIAASVDKQVPTELAFRTEGSSNLQAAVDRLAQRGVSAIVAVPLFLAGPAPSLDSAVKAAIPLRTTTGLNGDPVAAEIVLGRAQAISKDPAGEVLVLVSHRLAPGAAGRWVPDLQTIAQQLNRPRRFASILVSTIPVEASAASANDTAMVRGLVERFTASGRRILVVPVVTPYGGVEAAIAEQFHGLAHDVAKSALAPDDRLVAWIASRAAGR